MRDNSEKMKMVGERAIAVFDLDGTLVETDAANSAAYRAALLGCGCGEVPAFMVGSRLGRFGRRLQESPRWR